MGARGQAYYNANLAVPVGVARIAEMFERVSGSPGAPRPAH
jgi:hypothetical protein